GWQIPTQEEEVSAPQGKKDVRSGDDRLLRGVPGYAILLEACVQCHDLRPIVSQRKSSAAWRRSINEMVWRGAPLMPGEAEVLTRYLAASFGPEHSNRPLLQPRKAARGEGAENLATHLPPGRGRALVLGACVQCHDLILTLSQRKSLSGWRRSIERMAHLGARLNGSEVEIVAQYLAHSFGPGDPIPDAVKRHPGFLPIEQ